MDQKSQQKAPTQINEDIVQITEPEKEYSSTVPPETAKPPMTPPPQGEIPPPTPSGDVPAPEATTTQEA